MSYSCYIAILFVEFVLVFGKPQEKQVVFWQEIGVGLSKESINTIYGSSYGQKES